MENDTSPVEVVGQELWRTEWLAKNEKYKQSHFLRYIRGRTARNRNTQLLMVGSQGSGKSSHNISSALLLDPTFTVEQIVFHPIELLRLVNTKKLLPGSVIICEEMGTQAPSASWQSKDVRLLSQFFETARRMKLNFFLNTPSRDRIAKSIRTLMHIEASPKRIDEHKRLVKCRAYLLQPNALRGKIYIHKLQKKTPEGKIPIRTWTAPEPPAVVWKQYNDKRDDFQRQLNAGLLSEFEGFSVSGKDVLRLARCKKCNRIYRSEFFSEDSPPRKCSTCSSKDTFWYVPEKKNEDVKDSEAFTKRSVV